MRVSSCFNGGPGRTRTYDQGIMSPRPPGFTPFQPITPHRCNRLILRILTSFPFHPRILLAQPVLVPRGTPGASPHIAMPTTTLTDKLCERVRPPQTGHIELFDRNLPGFCLRVSEKGRKSFCLLYRVNGIKRRLTIGPYTGTGSLRHTRDRARKALMAAAEGRDPATEKAEARRLRRYRRGGGRGLLEASTWRGSRTATGPGASWTRRSSARWRYRRIGQITRRDIIAVVDEVAARGTTGHADKVRAWTHALMNWCLSRDLIEANPAAGVRKPHKAQVRSRVLGDEELRGIWTAAEALGYPFGPVAQLLILTGQRRGEVCRMCWSDVDLKERLWVMGDTKGGRPHAVPLVPRACAILGRFRARATCVQHPGDGPLSGAFEEQAAPGQASGVQRWIFHDFRRTLRTALARLGFEKHVCDRVPGHVTPNVIRLL